MKPGKLHVLATPALLALAALAAAPALQAQQVYRIVGPDGKVTFSDRLPAADTGANARPGGASGAAPGSSAAAQGLPYELRQVALKYPVVLYTSESCAPCVAGRSLLTSRGIPFSEKTVTTAADSQALQRLSGETSLPFLTIGSQQLKGFSDTEWTEFLNAAGYPKSSVLPASYRAPASTPLVTAAPAPAGSAESKATQGMPSVLPPPSPGNPAGIKF